MLARLCVARATQPGTIHAVIDAFKSAGWLEIAGQILRESLEREDVHPDIAFGWTRYCHGEDWDRCQATLDGLRERPDLWRYASAGYVGTLAEHREGIRFKNYLAGHREVFREDSLLWHSIASTLVQFGKEAEAVDSYFDRPEHIAAEPKLLLDLAVAAYKLGKKVESWEMHESAIRLPADESTSAHLLWLASRDIFQRGYAQAEGRLRVVDPQLLPEYYQALCALVTSMAEIHARRKQAGTLSFRRAQQMLRTAANPHLPTIRSDARLNHYYKRCLRRIAKDNGGFFANAWTRLRTSLS